MRRMDNVTPDAALVDTSAWFAYINGSDIYHRQAVSQLSNPPASGLITTTYVVDECSRLANLHRNRPAIQFTWHLWREDFARVVEPDSEVQGFAWQLFRSIRREGLSFTDCVSIAFIRRYGVVDVIAYGALSRYLNRESGSRPDQMTAG